MSAERKGRSDGSGVSSAACRCNGSGVVASVDGEAMDCQDCDAGSDAAASRETLRRYADYAIRHGVKFNDGRGNEIEVGPTIIDQLDEIERVSKENASLRGYVTTVASGMSRNDLLAIEREFTGCRSVMPL